ncbi:2Fe-2S iron-sulfur cluster-binding protein [Bradyrhizobium sp. STM 3562]|uniref:2Fe-2S iron-sulfur cluster-binding protein n=1 Tax=Bradyrhizobium sp. STM 3562 TaxID=578924 RepID=UPI00388EE91A
MPRITFIHPDGRDETVEADTGATVMVTALTHGLDGILAECGGNAMCATCHVYVDPAWLDKLPPRSNEEDALLDGTAAECQPNSRLSCQIKITPELEGLVLRLPDRQT